MFWEWHVGRWNRNRCYGWVSNLRFQIKMPLRTECRATKRYKLHRCAMVCSTLFNLQGHLLYIHFVFPSCFTVSHASSGLLEWRTLPSPQEMERWDVVMWTECLRKNRILVGTPEVFRQALEKGALVVRWNFARKNQTGTGVKNGDVGHAVGLGHSCILFLACLV